MPDTAHRFRTCPVPEDVLRLLLETRTDQAVADTLHVPRGTVSTWRSRLGIAPCLKTGGVRVLAAIQAHPGQSLTQLAQVLGMSREAMRQAVDRLEARGLVTTVKLKRHQTPWGTATRHCWVVEGGKLHG
jgi:DNA-binding transcriptional ArsR family regulator